MIFGQTSGVLASLASKAGRAQLSNAYRHNPLVTRGYTLAAALAGEATELQPLHKPIPAYKGRIC